MPFLHMVLLRVAYGMQSRWEKVRSIFIRRLSCFGEVGVKILTLMELNTCSLDLDLSRNKKDL